jgi:hypothetical protein
MNEIDDYEIKERDVTAEQKHRDDDNEGGIGQFLEAADPFVLRFPGPRRFPQLGKNFAEKVSRFRDHGDCRDEWGKRRTPNAERPMSNWKGSIASVIRDSVLGVQRSAFSSL